MPHLVLLLHGLHRVHAIPPCLHVWLLHGHHLLLGELLHARVHRWLPLHVELKRLSGDELLLLRRPASESALVRHSHASHVLRWVPHRASERSGRIQVGGEGCEVGGFGLDGMQAAG